MHKNATFSDILWAAACALAALLMVNSVPGLDTNQIQFGDGNTYDGLVKIERNASGQMTFTDTALTSPVTLSELNSTVPDHSDLSGLSNDDHPIYLNQTRHQSIHDIDFNTSLTLPADAAGNTTLGHHVTDNRIHLPADQVAEITAPWRFTDTPQIWNNLHLSNNGTGGDCSIIFEDGADDAAVLWNDSEGAFSINRGLSISNGDIDLEGILFGDVAKNETDTEYFHLTMDDDEANDIIHDRRGRFDARLTDPTGTPETQAHSVPGKIGNAIAFDGLDDSIVIENNVGPCMDYNQDFTIALWWRSPASWTQFETQKIVDYYLATAAPPSAFGALIEIRQQDNGNPYIQFRAGLSGLWYNSIAISESSGVFIPDTWNHFAVRIEGETLTYFFNGVSIYSATNSGINVDMREGKFRLGASSNGTSSFAEGIMDDFRLYNHALSDSQIAAIFHDGNGTGSAVQHVLHVNGVTNMERLSVDGEFTTDTAKIQVGGGAYCDGTTWVTASSKDMKTNVHAISENTEWDILDAIQPVEFYYKKKNPNRGAWVDSEGNRVPADSITWQILNDPNPTDLRLSLEDQGYHVSTEKWLDEPDGPKRIGFIAEDLAKVDPRFNRGPGVAAIDVAAYNTAVLKAMKARIIELENRIATLEKAINP